MIGGDADDNDQSCVLLVQMGRSTILFPGDIEMHGERSLLVRVMLNELIKNRTDVNSKTATDKRFALGRPLTVMLAPHHGSRTSSGDAFVDAWEPEHIVFPAGHRNRLGFPHDAVLMRYKIRGSEPYVTGRDGAIRFVLGPFGLTEPPTRYWVKNRRLWHRPVVDVSKPYDS